MSIAPISSKPGLLPYARTDPTRAWSPTTARVVVRRWCGGEAPETPATGVGERRTACERRGPRQRRQMRA
eukprot:3575528-Alexandrium_andersonii.AAC.1